MVNYPRSFVLGDARLWHIQYYQDVQNVNETGIYKHNFSVDIRYNGRKVFIVFDASMTETEVKINGKSAGPKHAGAFYQFKYDCHRLIELVNLICWK
jgi:hypothetical protein